MHDIEDLYQSIIIDHYKYPKNFKKNEKADFIVESENPLCGDRIIIYSNKKINKIISSFHGKGCAISIASASIMINKINNLSIKNAEYYINTFYNIIIGKKENIDIDNNEEYVVFSNICNYPSRIKCATLALHNIKKIFNKIQNEKK